MKNIETIIAKKNTNITVSLGHPYSIDDTYTIFDRDIKIIREDGKILAIFRKGALKDNDLLQAGRNLSRYKVTTRSRGMAAGINKSNKMVNPNGGLGAGNMVASAIVGYTEANGFYKCRQTMLYKKHKEIFDNETQKLLQYITNIYREFAPENYKIQNEFVAKINQNMRLGQSVFTTITVNVDFRTMAHTDKGDYHNGLGNLMVFQTGNFKGGELMLPEYQIAFNIQEGDILLFDSHEIHCNNTIVDKGRVSLVCYAREKILNKCDGVTMKQLQDNSSIVGVDRSRKATRKRPDTEFREKKT